MEGRTHEDGGAGEGGAGGVARARMADSDPENATYTPELSAVYDANGRPARYQREKYAPIVDALASRLRARGRGPSSARLLDVGVGYGVFLRMCQDAGFTDLHGMDPFPGSMAIARRHSKACLTRGRIEDDPWPVAERGPFDAVTCLDVVEHLPDPSVFFSRVGAVLAPGGTVVVRTPLFGLPYRLRGIPLVGVPDRNETHISLKPPREWSAMASAAGFRAVAQWRGEHLTHLRPMEWLGAGLSRMGVRHGRVPGLRAFEQACVMVLERRRA